MATDETRVCDRALAGGALHLDPGRAEWITQGLHQMAQRGQLSEVGRRQLSARIDALPMDESRAD